MRWVAISLLVVVSPLGARAADTPDFNRDVRPILAATASSATARTTRPARRSSLDYPRRGREGHVPGKPDESELVRRILPTDADEVMPPPSAKSAADATAEGDTQGAGSRRGEYAPHWAFVAPKRPAVPQDAIAPVRNPIDAFILARLEREGLKPSPEADRYTLIRRVYLDLIGLPPTPEEVDAVRQRQVARRLREARRSAARVAALRRALGAPAGSTSPATPTPTATRRTAARSIWPYRDWVINALNDDMPFDQFTIEQLAGDLLPNATPSQRIATGFHRNTMLNEEGGIDPLEFRFYADDRSRRHDRHRLARPDRRLRPVPHAQVRPDHSQRVLPLLRLPQQHRRAGDCRCRPRSRPRSGAEIESEDRRS